MEGAKNHFNVKRLVLLAAILTILLWAYPIEYRATRVASLGGLLVAFTGSLHLFWKSKVARTALIAVGVIPLILLSLPGRAMDRNALRNDYARLLRTYEGTRYVWGGESYWGIDCSGLVRKPLMLACLTRGLRTMNGSLIRTACWLWWHDASALALRDGYRDLTIPIPSGAGGSVNEMEESLLIPGDLAVTEDGVHVLAYVGGSEWIEADPQLNRVVRLSAPSENPWFEVEVRMVRWRVLEE